MTAKNARLVANAILLTAGGALALLALRQRPVRRAAMRALPMMLGGTPPLHVAAFLVARALADRHHQPDEEPPEPAAPV
jgi:hypothetical protein